MKYLLLFMEIQVMAKQRLLLSASTINRFDGIAGDLLLLARSGAHTLISNVIQFNTQNTDYYSGGS